MMELTDEDYKQMKGSISDCINENNHVLAWNQNDIDLFVSQFADYKDKADDDRIDMSKFDPRFITEADMKKKYPLFEDDTIEVMTELENRKLEDMRIPPLKISRKPVKLINNLSDVVYNDEETN
jgi:hypothetical protein|tara:strand:- start:1610 stop:1981 length:372 start_codon:yes stop_codon:yes gene_type:complete